MIPLLTAAFIVTLAADTPSAWPGFRGDGTSVATDTNLPISWSPTENIAWKRSLPGYGQSAPIVWGNRVYVSTVSGPQKETYSVIALDARTGWRCWKTDHPSSQPGENSRMMSRAAPTPLADSEGVYAFFEGGDLIALDTQGKLRWKRSLVNDYGRLDARHGLGSSPVQTEQAVIQVIDHHGSSYVLAVDKRDGNTLWKTERPSQSCWSSPILCQAGGTPILLIGGNGRLDAYDPHTGSKIWSHTELTGNHIPSPTVAMGRVVIGAGMSRRNPSRQATARSNCCLLLEKGEAGGQRHISWHTEDVVCDYASPLIHRGLVYFTTKVGVVHCFDLQTGQRHYAERLRDACWATPVAAGDRIYFFGKKGLTTVLKAGPSYQELACNYLWGEQEGQTGSDAADRDGSVVYGVAAAGGAFFVRTGTELYCLRAE